jgi:hypothetical protein
MTRYSIARFSVGAPAGVLDAVSGFEPFVSATAPGDTGTDIELRLSGGEGDAAAMKFAAWLAFSHFALPHGAMPLHASAVVYGGSAVLFLGESGTGKSTHTALWRQHIEGAWLLNDDSPIVRTLDNGPAGAIVACGSPWSGKTPCYRAETVPLRALVRLRQGPKNRITRLHTMRAIGAVWPSCPPQMAGDPALRTLMLESVGRIVAAVPVYEMECRPDRDAALVAFEEIYNAQ